MSAVPQARRLFEEARYSEALAALEAHLETLPDDMQARLLYAQIFARQGNRDEALKQFTKIITAGIAPTEALRSRGDILMKQGLTDVAALDYENALEWEPNDVATHIKLANAAVASGRWPRALEAARRAVRLDPSNHEAYRALAEAHLAAPQAEYEPAVAALERAYQLAPSPALAAELARALCRYAVYNHRAENWAKANAVWQQAEAVDKNVVANFRNREGPFTTPQQQATARDVEAQHAQERYDDAVRFSGEGKFDDALVELTKAIELIPEVAAYYELRGRLFLAQSSPEAALADLSRAIELDAERAAAYVERGRAYGLLGNWSGAVHDFTEAMRRQPDLAAAYYNRGAAYFNQGRFDRALADLDNALRLAPDLKEYARSTKAAAHWRLAQQAAGQRQWDKATEHFARAAELAAPKDAAALAADRAEAFGQRALERAGEGDYEKALADAQQAVAVAARNARSHEVLGEVFLKRGEWSKAKEAFETAIRLDRHRAGDLRAALADAHRGLGDELFAAGRYQQALAEYDAAVELSPMNARNLLGRGKARYHLGQFTAARENLRLALDRAPELEPEIRPYLDRLDVRLGVRQLDPRR